MMSAISEDGLSPQIGDAAYILVALATALEDQYIDAFDAALSDLLFLLERTPTAITHVRRLVAKELDIPYDNQWRVSETGYEKRRNQVLLAIRQLPG